MSGIVGLLRFDNDPAERRDVSAMLQIIARRGPHASGVWAQGAVAFAHCALHGIPETFIDAQPYTRGHLTITADVRIDNRAELAGALEISLPQLATIGDAGLILRAYQAWGRDCARRILGDFAFAIWDEREQSLFCARDVFGARPFVYCRTPRVFAFASQTSALHAMKELPRRINEGRIADFLVGYGLEAINATCTFYQDILRLPPAHTLLVRAGTFDLQRYWQPEPREVAWASSDEVVEAFRASFAEAVRCRMRGDHTASMLSGGLDSSSIVAVARDDRRRAGAAPLQTFSAIWDDVEQCPDRKYVEAVVAQGGLDATFVMPSQAAAYSNEVIELLDTTDDPFDSSAAAIPFMMYVAGARRGVRVMLDGVDGDIVTSMGPGVLRYALREPGLRKAWRHVFGAARFFGASPARHLGQHGLLPWAWNDIVKPRVPRPLLALLPRYHRLASVRDARAWSQQSLILRAFAERIGLNERILAAGSARRGAPSAEHPAASAHAQTVVSAAIPVALERYDRAAAACSMETSHPFLDRRLVEVCLSIPWSEKVRQGIPKSLLRSAMKGTLPDTVVERGFAESPHWLFKAALLRTMGPWLDGLLRADRQSAHPFLDVASLRQSIHKARGGGFPARDPLYGATMLAWLHRLDSAGSGC